MSATTDETGRVVAEKYRLRRIVGEGGMGVVYAATHLWTDREVAVKVLHPYYARDQVTVHRFMREAKAAARLHHPHVVDVLDMGQREDGSVYMVMEMLVGETFADRLRRDGPLDPASALEVLLPIMDALAIAHDRGIVHRDLKPENLFLNRDRTGRVVPKLLDFGIAKMQQAQGGNETEAGSIVGTPAYMSPEQIRGVEVGPAADVWSVGVVLYEALAGRVPFRGETPTGILAAILTEDLPPLHRVAPSLPAPFAAAVERALQKDPAHRPPTMRAFEEVLLGAAAESHIALEGRVSRIDWDPSMAETQTDSIGQGLTAAVTKTLAPYAGRFAWVVGGLVALALVLGAGILVGLQRPWAAEPPRAPGAPSVAAPSVVSPAGPTQVAAPPSDAPRRQEAQGGGAAASATAATPPPGTAGAAAPAAAPGPVASTRGARARPASPPRAPDRAPAAPAALAAPPPAEAPAPAPSPRPAPADRARPDLEIQLDAEDDLAVPERWR